jgi:hypothetical protein
LRMPSAFHLLNCLLEFEDLYQSFSPICSSFHLGYQIEISNETSSSHREGDRDREKVF